MDLEAKLKAHGITLEPTWDGGLLRDGTQWLVSKIIITKDGKELKFCSFGDWRKGNKEVWTSASGDASTSKEYQAEVERQNKLERDEKEKLQNERALQCEDLFGTFSERGTSSYLQRKQIGELFGARLAPNENGDPITVVPLRDAHGKIWNYQRIFSKRLSAGDKFFTEGARIDGCFHTLPVDGALEKSPPGHLQANGEPGEIFICEGFATACSIALALRGAKNEPNQAPTGRATPLVVAAFNAGNLQAVAVSLHAKYPQARIVLCADNDAYTVINEKPYNVGIEKARRAAGACKGELVYPVFKHPQKTLTDFNDLHAAEGLERVLDQLLNPGAYQSGIQPMILELNAHGQPKVPTEKAVSDYLMAQLKDKIVRQDKALFMYCGTHWIELDSVGVDKLKQWVGVASQHRFKMKEIDATYRYFFTHVPSVPRGTDLYCPNPFAANFSDGTLHFVKQGSKYKLEFRPHEPSDFLTNVLPYQYPTNHSMLTPKLEEWLGRLWNGDPCSPGKIRLYKQLMGASLMSAFPVIVFFKGKPRSGKSSLIKLILKLVSQENTSNVQPCEMHGFNMETMVGKLVNYDTDVDTQKPINDTELKKIIDRIPRRIRRKGKVDATGPLPAVHLFASNELPRTLDGASHAYAKRIIFLETDGWTAPEIEDLDFVDDLWNDTKEEVLSAAVSGLLDLFESRGHYFRPEDSARLVKAMENESDLVEQFLNSVKENEVQEGEGFLKIDAGLRIRRNELWGHFAAWQRHSMIALSQQVTAGLFYRRMVPKFEVKQSTEGVRFYAGIGFVHKSEKTAGTAESSSGAGEPI